MKVRATALAREDARRAGDRLDAERRGFGAAFAAEFRRAVASIRANPRLHGRTEDGPDEPETRECFIARFEYRVIYTFWNSEAVIVVVIHARHRPGAWITRLTDINTQEDSP